MVLSCYTDLDKSELKNLLVDRLSESLLPLAIFNCFEGVSAFCEKCCSPTNPTTSPPTPAVSPSTDDTDLMETSLEGLERTNEATAIGRGVTDGVMIGSNRLKNRLDAWIRVILTVLKVIVILQIVFLLSSLPMEYFKNHITTSFNGTTVGHLSPTPILFQRNMLSIFQPPSPNTILPANSTKLININERSVAYCVDHHSYYKEGAFGCLSMLTDADDAIVSDLRDCEKDLSITRTEITDCAKAGEEGVSCVPLQYCVKVEQHISKERVLECLKNRRKDKSSIISYSDEGIKGGKNTEKSSECSNINKGFQCRIYFTESINNGFDQQSENVAEEVHITVEGKKFGYHRLLSY